MTTRALIQFSKAFKERLFKAVYEDVIVDYLTAPESLVFYREKKTIEQAGRVIGLAMGMLLGDNQKERNAIKETLVRAYDLRNVKVHGNIGNLGNMGKSQ